jgi:VIT1/CCC1 family predicted Fe2+/Mn2+ transporter
MRRRNPKRVRHEEVHRSGRAGWLRAAVLGSDDAIVSTASLMAGVAASAATREAILIAGIAGLVAGSMSMAVGEYVSVSSQHDVEKRELVGQPEGELNELATIYVKRGLEPDLAMKVAVQLSAYDRLGAHLRDELGIHPAGRARPMQAASVSAASFASFALIPIGALLVAPAPQRIPVIAIVSLLSLAVLGAFGAHLGGAPLGRGALRVTIGGTLAMGVTVVIGRLLGSVV